MTASLRSLLFAIASIAAVGAASQLTACSDASGEMSGGTALFDAAAEPTSVATADGGVLSCAGPDAGTGTTWTDLYTDYFGPTGGANCSGGAGSSCHADSSGAGYAASNFACGSDKDACSPASPGKDAELLVASDSANPAGSGLENDLRQTTGSGNMPKAPICTFTAADIARLSAWISAGMKND